VPFLTLTMAWNEGINFGLFDFGAAGRWLLVALALGIVAAIVVWLRRGRGWGPAVGGGLIIGGALGNVWDRVQYGAVADFLNVACCGIANPFAFNVADTAIFVGVVIIFVFAREPAGRDARPGATGRDGPGGVR
jgi:signal peptidase II